MTKQEAFKRRVRQRMVTTGERYAAARRALLAANGASDDADHRRWVSPPEMDDDAVRAATGRGWNDWCDLIEGWPDSAECDHTAIAARLVDSGEVDGWWAQTVTVGFERIVGRRLPYQRADGTFSVGVTRTVRTDVARLRALLLDDDARADLFPDQPTRLRSRPSSKAIRFDLGDGVAQVAMTARPDGRIAVSVAQEKLTDPESVERWRHYLSEWLEAIDDD